MPVMTRNMVDLQDKILTKNDEKFNDFKTAMIAEISQDELEQYGRRLCIRIDSVPVAENETSNDVLQNVKSIIEESSSEIPHVAINRAHRIGKTYTDKTSGVKCKSIIVRFTTFRHRTMFYDSRKNLKHNVKGRLDLTKRHYLQLVKNNEAVKFVMADINCCLKVIFKDGNSLFLVIVIIYVIF